MGIPLVKLGTTTYPASRHFRSAGFARPAKGIAVRLLEDDGFSLGWLGISLLPNPLALKKQAQINMQMARAPRSVIQGGALAVIFTINLDEKDPCSGGMGRA
ncbi:hypothetical protein [Thiorhodococcus minor]|uniref:Uncharacterized protein n=1 Tax=Thiorhodococcus minor TaxID=57489 RepID=A0A6M0JW06_9GAMM|nr:hypothetical protein [Thiorhodococcus minor]NEV61101.1 hypothetical protein [Thiorhodococcus minor]